MCFPASKATQQIIEALGWTEGVDFTLPVGSMGNTSSLLADEVHFGFLPDDDSWVIRRVRGKARLNPKVFKQALDKANKTPFRRSS
jgi:hypothetical protein